ncbi:MAG: iron ABC transporter ATP-binding protein [Thiotrichales bacterium SG8_50]|nr:MAG: iron ABC transporter ATP-binding protein [Thiotrichales bacterium SG8_50]
MAPLLQLRNVECRYGAETAVAGVSLHANSGDIVCLLGPSGCGKSTVLRAIAGFHPLTKGEIALRNDIVSRPGYTRAPERRRLGMVFQDYALFPHLDVARNITFGLRTASGTDKSRVLQDMLELVGLKGMEHRFPHELSGGQQQRVALARALAPKPDLVLLDEPFSNLDVEMRERLSLEVREIFKTIGVTAVLVTHDQHEAFAIGDQIGVMHRGQLMQWDTAYNLYHDPANPFVADFIGSGVFLRGRLLAHDAVETELGIIKGDRAYDWPIGSMVRLLVRPDDIVPADDSALEGEVVNKAFKGAEMMYTLRLPSGNTVLAMFPSHHNHQVGERVRMRVAADHMVAFLDTI